MLKSYFDFKPFSETEAWTLFRLAAIGEAVGWTILITGMALSKLIGSSIPVMLAGQFHGLLFLIYLTIAVLVSPSLSWKPKKILLAIACSVPPYGTLAFEIWQARHNNDYLLKHTLYRLYLQELTGWV